jgi:hypothetical protein
MEFVTTREVTVDTPVGPVIRLETVPLRPMASFQAGPSSQPQLGIASQMDNFDIGMSCATDETPKPEPSKNKVVEIYF